MHPLVKKGKSGADEIDQMMQEFREHPPRELGGSQVIKVVDYQNCTKTDSEGNTEEFEFTKSNVLQFFTEDGSKISVRPSGTEPKIKFYFSANCPLDSKDALEETILSLQKRLDSLRLDIMK